MPKAGRVGDEAQCSNHSAKGPAKAGSPDVMLNGRAAMRVGDTGSQDCCGTSTWSAEQGSSSVFINGKPAYRIGDPSKHCGGKGELVEGSPDVWIGDKTSGTPKPLPHDRVTTIDVTDGLGRPVQGAVVHVTCPHHGTEEHEVSGSATASNMCSGSTITVTKALQKGSWDEGASSGHVSPSPPANVPAPDGSTTSHIVQAPAPAATPPDHHAVTVVRPASARTTVRLTTVHNWIELVYRAFGQELPTAATELGILGVREASLSGRVGVDGLEARAGEGDVDQVGFTRETRQASLSAAPTTWNDLLFCAFTADDVRRSQHVEVFECTIDAGQGESSLGLPITLEGKLYRCKPGSHIVSRYPGSDTCLHIYSGSYGHIELAREATRRSRIFTSVASAQNAATGWRFASNEANASIHMHFGAESGRVGAWSTGCTVLHHHYFVKGKDGRRHADPNATRYRRFRELYLGAANKTRIPYLVVSSKYVRSYPEWLREIAKKPDEIPGPETVLRKDELESPNGMSGRYVPSFMTKPFADAVLALAARDHAHAAHLRSSLELCLLTPAV